MEGPREHHVYVEAGVFSSSEYSACIIDGVTYVALVPFRMVGAGLGTGPGVPWLGTFLETNVRFYSVDDEGRRGVVFASLDASRLAVVLGAQAAFTVLVALIWRRGKDLEERVVIDTARWGALERLHGVC